MGLFKAPKVKIPDPLPAPATAVQPKNVEDPELDLEIEDTPSQGMIEKKKGKKVLRVDNAGVQSVSSDIAGLQIPKL